MISDMSISDSKPAPRPSASSGPAVSQRPVSKTESSNPREFQINQLRRRFRPEEKTDESGTSLTFGLAPSDPDFPFELDSLNCVLHVPTSYPSQGRPRLRVTNAEMETAFQENVSRGFDDIVDTTLRFGGRRTLLSWMNSLDKQLERLLATTERGPKLTFVTNLPSKGTSEDTRLESERAPHQVHAKPSVSPRPQPVPWGYTATEKVEAEKRRATEAKQIEARLGRLPLFQKRPDGISYIVPIQPSKPDRLPAHLQSIRTVKLTVPRTYPLEPSSIELQRVEQADARPVQVGFANWIRANGNLNLMSQINYLASNLHTLAKTPLETPSAPSTKSEPPLESNVYPEPSSTTHPLGEAEDRPHIHVIPRPPEWNVGETGDTSDDDFTEESSEEPTDEDEGGGAPVPDLPEQTKGSGVALSFPSLELYGIELLELTQLSITIKCDRCKEHMDVKNVPQTTDKSDSPPPRIETCKKCTNSMSIGRKHSSLSPQGRN